MTTSKKDGRLTPKNSEMEDNIKKKLKTTSKKNGRWPKKNGRWPKKNENRRWRFFVTTRMTLFFGMQPYFDPTRKTTSK